jgi:predicted CxxxxCH...CXXCH cytochrome family protein
MPRRTGQRVQQAGSAALACLLALLAGCHKSPLADGLPADVTCHSCHGSADNDAPPQPAALDKTLGTSSLHVGAHQLHVRDGLVRKALACSDCHPVPKTVDEKGHVAPGPARMQWGPLASARAVTPAWDRESATCTNYCHGQTLKGGSATSPLWTYDQVPPEMVNRTDRTCQGCHGYPPPSPHPQDRRCGRCHSGTVDDSGAIRLEGGLHLDGKVDLDASACNICHGNEKNAAPPLDTAGNASTSAPGVGAHQVHLADSALRKAIACGECHKVPASVDEPGHLDHPLPALLTFGPLASAGGAVPSFDAQALTCTVYCHGATLSGGGATAPVWTRVDGSQTSCTSCHGYPPPAPHPQRSQCALCHPGTVQADGSIDVNGGLHINGSVESVGSGCTGCHGTQGVNPAPPRDLEGNGATTALGVGAHQAHLVASSSWHKPLACADCHLVPTKLDDPGHLDHPLPAQLTWSSLAAARGASPSFDSSNATCNGVYCHGAKTRGGTNKSPLWVGGSSEAECGTCHGAPPANHYGDNCSWCHPTMKGGVADGFADPARHIDGKVDVVFGPCGSCHAVPALSGAHLAHFGEPNATSTAFALVYGDLRTAEQFSGASGDHAMYGCGNCHPTDPAKHMDGFLQIELSSDGAPTGTVRGRNLPTAAYDPKTGTCSGVYCHSSGQADTWDGQSPPSRLTPLFAVTPSWSGGEHTTCTSCHQNPPRYPSGGAGSITANGHLQYSPLSGYDEGHFRGVAHDWHGAQAGGASAVTCQTCHFATVSATNTAAANPARDPSRPFASGYYYLDTSGDYVVGAQGSAQWRCASCHTGKPGEPAAGTGKVRPLYHANGRRDVVFDDRQAVVDYPFVTGQSNPVLPLWQAPLGTTCQGNTSEVCGIWQQRSVVNANTWSFRLSNTFTDTAHPQPAPAYDPATKTCWYMGCHLGNPSPVWGAPMGTFNGCTTCHAK